MKSWRSLRWSYVSRTILLVLLMAIVQRQTVYAQEILKFDKKVSLDQREAFIASASDFCVLEDECFVLCDYKDQKILVYDQKGRYLSGWRKQGQGPGEYQGIWYISYQPPFLAIADLRQPKILLYERTGKGDFRWLKDIPESGRIIKDFVLKNGELCFETTILHDERFYSIHIRDLDASHDEYLFPAAVRYGGGPDDNHLKIYEADYNKVWGKAYSFIDVLDRFIYSTWIGDLKIFKIDRNTKEWVDFGRTTKNYRPLKLDTKKPSPGLNIKQIFEHYRKESVRFSWIGGVFADQGLVGLLYMTFNDRASKWEVFLQFYSPDGEFLKECVLPDVIPIETYLRYSYYRESGFLYFLNMIDEEDKEIGFEILKYKIMK